MPTDEELLSRQMPHSVEAEQAVLGSILIDSECLPQIVEQLKPDDFYIRQNREAFQTIYTMFSMSQKIDPVTVLNQMRLDGTYQEGVTREYFFQLMDVTPTVTNVMDYVAIVKDRSTLRQIAEAANALNSMVANNEGTSAEVLEAAEQRIYAIRQGKSAQGLHHITSVMHEVYDRLAELASSDSAVPGLSTGLPDVDTVISGLNKSDLILLAARPGMGKTSLALNILLYAGKHSGKACVFFSLEMSREQLAMRLLSNESFVDNKKLTTGSLTDEDWEKVALAAIKYGDLRNQPAKDYVFDVDRFTAFEGDTGPYIMYTMVRIKSILSKFRAAFPEAELGTILAPDRKSETDLMLVLSKFNENVYQTYEQKAPNKLCHYIYELTGVFNQFYNECNIMKEQDPARQASYVTLLQLVLHVLEIGIDLLGFSAPDRM